LETRLRARRHELEEATFERVTAIGDRQVASNPAYITGFRLALQAAFDYGLAALTDLGGEPASVPVELLVQARLAARSGVGLDAVLRRYAAGHSLFAESVIDEAAASNISLTELKETLEAVAKRYDRILEAVSEEHACETDVERESPEQRRCRLLRRLLAGEQLETSGLGYEFEAHHVALVALGSDAHGALASLRGVLDRQLLLARNEDKWAWAWLGGRRSFCAEEIARIEGLGWPEETAVACGAPGHGLAGWRMSHRQASSALSVAIQGGLRFASYNKVALLTAFLGDEDLVAYLRDSFIVPLAAGRGGGRILQDTLKAYFTAACSISSAAAMLGVARQTVTSRLRTAEDRLGRPLSACRQELEAALDVAGMTRCDTPS